MEIEDRTGEESDLKVRELKDGEWSAIKSCINDIAIATKDVHASYVLAALCYAYIFALDALGITRRAGIDYMVTLWDRFEKKKKN